MARRPVEKTCEQCGKRWTTRVASSRTCSPQCRGAARELAVPPRHCSGCGAELKRHRFASGKLEFRRVYMQRKFCSPDCATQHQDRTMERRRSYKGAGHPLWKGGQRRHPLYSMYRSMTASQQAFNRRSKKRPVDTAQPTGGRL